MLVAGVETLQRDGVAHSNSWWSVPRSAWRRLVRPCGGPLHWAVPDRRVAAISDDQLFDVPRRRPYLPRGARHPTTAGGPPLPHELVQRRRPVHEREWPGGWTAAGGRDRVAGRRRWSRRCRLRGRGSRQPDWRIRAQLRVSDSGRLQRNHLSGRFVECITNILWWSRVLLF